MVCIFTILQETGTERYSLYQTFFSGLFLRNKLLSPCSNATLLAF